MNALKCILVTVLMTGSVPPPKQQSDMVAQTIERYRRQGDVFLSRVRTEVFKASTDSDKIIENQIVYAVTPVGGVNGFAYQINGKRYIEITAGMIEIMDWLGTNRAVTTVRGTALCGAHYVQYVSDGISENSDRYRDKLALREVTSPYQFYYANKSDCPQISPSEVDSDEQISQLREIGMTVMLQLVLAHEIGHQIHNDPFSKVNWCEQQHRESRADAYSFQALRRMGNPPSAGIDLIMIFASVEGFSAEDSNHTHPAALKRMLAMLEATREQYRTDESLMDGLRRSGDSKKFFQTLDGMETTIRKEIASAKIADPDSVCSE